MGRVPEDDEATPRRDRGDCGFTLVELMLALAIAGALASLAAPQWRNVTAEIELRERADALARAMSTARSEAIKRGARVDLCPGAPAAGCVDGAGWETGWISYVRDAEPTSIDVPPAALRREGPARPGITIRGNRPVADYVSFTSIGHARRHDGALQMGTFTVCRPGQRALRVVLANSGRLRVDATAEACP